MATLFVGQNKVYLPVTDSTNSYATGLLKNVNPHEGTAVYTDHQTHGRGQRGNVWEADAERNLTLSVIFKPHFLNAKKSFYLSKIAALSVYDVLAEILIGSQFDIKIKWPNDILAKRKKITGILIENSFKDEVFQWSVIGIGLNVNQDSFGELTNATSLSLLTERTFDRAHIMERLFVFLEKWYLALRNEKYELIDAHYSKHLYGLDQTLMFESGSEQFKARMVRVSEQGLLELELDDKTLRRFDVKEVRFV
jgi:BirA family transcriptional regulator, biotin operon repressor / biotin---[acetyl-CoA-carboxylase] ligase